MPLQLPGAQQTRHSHHHLPGCSRNLSSRDLLGLEPYPTGVGLDSLLSARVGEVTVTGIAPSYHDFAGNISSD